VSYHRSALPTYPLKAKTMAKEKGQINVSPDATPAPRSQERVEALLAAYKKQNPVKYAQKEARGEFKKLFG